MERDQGYTPLEKNKPRLIEELSRARLRVWTIEELIRKLDQEEKAKKVLTPPYGDLVQ